MEREKKKCNRIYKCDEYINTSVQQLLSAQAEQFKRNEHSHIHLYKVNIKWKKNSNKRMFKWNRCISMCSATCVSTLYSTDVLNLHAYVMQMQYNVHMITFWYNSKVFNEVCHNCAITFSFWTLPSGHSSWQTMEI